MHTSFTHYSKEWQEKMKASDEEERLRIIEERRIDMSEASERAQAAVQQKVGNNAMRPWQTARLYKLIHTPHTRTRTRVALFLSTYFIPPPLPLHNIIIYTYINIYQIDDNKELVKDLRGEIDERLAERSRAIEADLEWKREEAKRMQKEKENIAVVIAQQQEQKRAEALKAQMAREERAQKAKRAKEVDMKKKKELIMAIQAMEKLGKIQEHVIPYAVKHLRRLIDIPDAEIRMVTEEYICDQRKQGFICTLSSNHTRGQRQAERCPGVTQKTH